MPQANPFAVFEPESPQLGDGEVLQLVQQHYGLEVRLKALLGERDQNFQLQCDDGRQYVLKIANAAEDPLVTDFQIQALTYLESYVENNDCPINVPRILRTVDGNSQLLVTSAGGQHVARIVTYIPGIPLADTPASPILCRHLGTFLAHLGRALKGFEHPGSAHGLLWDMQQALQLREILEHVPVQDLRQRVAQTLNDFEVHAWPHFGAVRSQVIHSDFNPDNVVLDSGDRSRVAGVIDFGDMVKAPLVVDVAIGASYLHALDGNPLARIAEFLVGYHSVTPLEIPEIDMLFDLIKTRLAASIVILSWRASLRGADDPYLAGAVASEGGAAKFLKILLEMPRQNAQQTFREICASANSENQAY